MYKIVSLTILITLFYVSAMTQTTTEQPQRKEDDVCGFFIGTGIGLAIRGAVLDGTEIAALLISKKSSILKGAYVIDNQTDDERSREII